MSISMIGLDTAKSVFQIHGVNESGKVELKRKLHRSELIAFFQRQESCTVVMEACGAHARRPRSHGEIDCRRSGQALRGEGQEERCGRCRSDLRSCVPRPDAKFVSVKTVEQQGILALHAARSLLVKQQTMLANAMRGLATEFGVTVPKSIRKLGELMTLVDTDEAIPKQAKQAITGLHDYCKDLSEGIETFEAEIVAAISDAVIGPMPGIVARRWAVSSCRACATIVDINLF
jgi:transposase